MDIVNKTVIVNAHVISPGVDIENATIVVEGKKVKQVIKGSKPVKPDAKTTVVDVRGQYVMPGFIDKRQGLRRRGHAICEGSRHPPRGPVHQRQVLRRAEPEVRPQTRHQGGQGDREDLSREANLLRRRNRGRRQVREGVLQGGRRPELRPHGREVRRPQEGVQERPQAHDALLQPDDASPPPRDRHGRRGIPRRGPQHRGHLRQTPRSSATRSTSAPTC